MQNDFISREAAIESLNNRRQDTDDILESEYEASIAAISAVPAADVVQVVQCKDCKHWTHDHDGGRWCWCRSLDIGTAPDFYCKDGCRMDGGDRHD